MGLHLVGGVLHYALHAWKITLRNLPKENWKIVTIYQHESNDN